LFASLLSTAGGYLTIKARMLAIDVRMLVAIPVK